MIDLARSAVKARAAFPPHLASSSIACSLVNPADTISRIEDSGNDWRCWEWDWDWDWWVELGNPSIEGRVESEGCEGEGDGVIA